MAWQDTVRAASRKVVSKSTHKDVVPEDPADLLAQARSAVGDPELSLEVYSAARLACSEYYTASPEVWAAVIDAETNRAERRGVSLYQHLTGGTDRYGRQLGVRKASTRLDPNARHIAAARAVLESGEARGISRGAIRFFDPKSQQYIASTRGAAAALVVLERWSYDYPWRNAREHTLNRDKPGSDPQAWVGHIDGIDPWELMLFARSSLGDEHTAAYQAARAIIEAHVGGPGFRDAGALVAVLALAKFGGILL